MKHILAMILVLGLVPACDSGSGSSSGTQGKDAVSQTDTTGVDTAVQTDTGGTDTAVTPQDTEPGKDTFVPEPDNYPPPPYGKAVGGIIEDHNFLNPTDNSVTKLSDYYQKPGLKYLLVNASAGWCSACKQEAVELNDIFAQYKHDGFDIMYTLFEDWNGGPPDKTFYDGWMSQYGGDYTVVLDTGFEMGVYFNVEATPMNMLIDLQTMEIVWLETGYNSMGLKAKLDELLY